MIEVFFLLSVYSLISPIVITVSRADFFPVSDIVYEKESWIVTNTNIIQMIWLHFFLYKTKYLY